MGDIDVLLRSYHAVRQDADKLQNAQHALLKKPYGLVPPTCRMSPAAHPKQLRSELYGCHSNLIFVRLFIKTTQKGLY